MDRNLRTGLIIGGIVVALLVIVPVIVGLMTGWETCMLERGDYSMMGGFGFGWFMLIFWIVVLGLVIWAVVSLVRNADGTSGQGSVKQSALEILKSRYAKGEIGKEEFEEKRKDLI